MTGLQTTTLEVGAELALFDGPSVDLNGVTFVPDASKAYVKFRLAYGFPVVSAYRTAVHPNVVSTYHQSMLHQNLNVQHKIKLYDPAKNGRDWIIGAIAAVKFPEAPFGGFKVAGLNETPGMECVATIFKQAEKSQVVLGEHLTNRRKWSVSLEMGWSPEDSGILVHQDDLATVSRKEGSSTTPDDLAALGFHYFPAAEDPGLMNEVYSVKRRGVVAKYMANNVVVLCGGTDGQIHYQGVAMVPVGAEPTAAVDLMVAEDPEAEVFEGFAETLVEQVEV